MAPFRTKQQQQQALVPVCTRMNLRSFRNVPLVPMETSSSDDSCDSFGSDGFCNTKRSYTRARVTAKMSKVFEVTPDEETSDGFSEKDVSNVMAIMNVDSGSECSEPPLRVRRSQTLKVALKFPSRKMVHKKALSTGALPQAKDPESNSEKSGSFLDKRALNIRENKAMLSKLMAELNKVPGLIPKRTSLLAANTSQSVTRHSVRPPSARRRNPERTSRPFTRSRSLIDGPPAPQPEEDPEEDKFSLVRRSRRYEEVMEETREPRRRGAMAIIHVVRPVEDITQAELDNICFNSREKVYGSTGSTCHQCRQKTMDSKTNCRNPECVGVRGQFCGSCLRNRYGEEVQDALLDPEWRCPPCRGICNCSFCRARDGHCATGVLVYLAKYHGYDNVHAYLLSLKRELEGSQ